MQPPLWPHPGEQASSPEPGVAKTTASFLCKRWLSRLPGGWGQLCAPMCVCVCVLCGTQLTLVGRCPNKWQSCGWEGWESHHRAKDGADWQPHCFRAAVSTHVAYRHQYECRAEEWWFPREHFGYLERCILNPSQRWPSHSHPIHCFKTYHLTCFIWRTKKKENSKNLGDVSPVKHSLELFM